MTLLNKKGDPLVIPHIPKGYAIQNAEQVLELAKVVYGYAKQSGLVVEFKNQGKVHEYAMAEAWQFAGSQLGLYSLVHHCDRVTENLKESEIRYSAQVELFTYDGDKLVGRGHSSCSSTELSKYGKIKFPNEYAVESMAQTRALGKAFRLAIGWFMKAAGFEGTPAEEIPDTPAEVTDEIRAEIEAFEDVIKLRAYGNSKKELHKVQEFIKLVRAKDAKLVEDALEQASEDINKTVKDANNDTDSSPSK